MGLAPGAPNPLSPPAHGWLPPELPGVVKQNRRDVPSSPLESETGRRSRPRCRELDGSIVDLTGATVTARMTNRATGAVKVSDAAAIVDDAAQGYVSLRMVGRRRRHAGRLRLHLPIDRGGISRTFPLDGPMVVEISPAESEQDPVALRLRLTREPFRMLPEHARASPRRRPRSPGAGLRDHWRVALEDPDLVNAQPDDRRALRLELPVEDRGVNGSRCALPCRSATDTRGTCR